MPIFQCLVVLIDQMLLENSGSKQFLGGTSIWYWYDLKSESLHLEDFELRVNVKSSKFMKGTTRMKSW